MGYFDDPALREYLWMAVLAIVFAFIMAFGIGANDTANAFASSVSAGSLSLKNAIFVASTMEFLGAILLGSSVTGTIRGKILDTEQYDEQPEILMFGNLCALLLASIWLLVATALEYPVSTTHTIVAAIIGFSIVAAGFDSVDWKTAGKIMGSWIVAPMLSGIFSFCFFWAVRQFVFKSENVFDRAMKTFPIVVFCAITIDVAFILLKGEKTINGNMNL